MQTFILAVINRALILKTKSLSLCFQTVSRWNSSMKTLQYKIVTAVRLYKVYNQILISAPKKHKKKKFKWFKVKKKATWKQVTFEKVNSKLKIYFLSAWSCIIQADTDFLLKDDLHEVISDIWQESHTVQKFMITESPGMDQSYHKSKHKCNPS